MRPPVCYQQVTQQHNYTIKCILSKSKGEASRSIVCLRRDLQSDLPRPYATCKFEEDTIKGPMPIIKATTLTNFVSRILHSAGTTAHNSHLVANSLVKSNLAGHDSHGVIRLQNYLDAIAAGNLDPTAEPVVARETGAISMVDAQLTFGQVGAHFAITVTIEKARIHGLAATGLYNCNHVGRLGEWIEMAADEGFIGLAFCNGGRPGGLVTPYGGTGRLMGTNPLAAAIPVAGRPPVLIDFATSTAAEGKVRVALNKGESVPEGWIQDSAGHPSTTPEDLYNAGALLPLGLHKGYCLSLLMEFMGGILTGNGSPSFPDYTALKNGVIFMVLSVDAFRPMEEFLADGAALSKQIKATPPAPGVDEVLLPGEPEQRAAEHRQNKGIPIDETTWVQLVEAANEFGVTIPEE